ncbi:uracil-DNA glycosylase [Paulownia witches'-broom phytoplasma]|uniref:Uracil-DNA glycosylase n=1 Tax=Paulownia witches'-broom phytoplasma TaxID=39647 RepID=A0ABX8TRH2_9MOLU|nr:uracil-DNA glycosylase [Paulownia witches'-broom phytoplasma]QYC30963.1 uracil-DNA glycosylase [Paulownia witches'-broom phytoplasma]
MWQQIINNQKTKLYFKKIFTFLQEEKTNHKIIYPNQEDIFAAFNLTPFEKVKVVILGQDPYHGKNQAHGLSFSVKTFQKPPSLSNIFKELQNDLQITARTNNLTKWALEGVLMINAILTVEKDKPLSHHQIGWQEFTKTIFQALQAKPNIVYILWGKFAQTYEPYICQSQNCIIKSPHPSPFSAHRGFFGSKPFSRANTYLQTCGIKVVDWNL